MQNEARDGAKDLGVSNCYVFKSRLQEYAQKVGFPTPVYETIKEGPSHEPSFRSTVIVNDVRYDSLPGFSNRKAAEQSAAEVALVEMSKSGEVNHYISVPVHGTGLCKNLLQEYAQKMNFAIPLYHCQKEEAPGRSALFSCTVEIGGIRYIGTCAKTKKEAEIKAATIALLAIQSSTSQTLEKQDVHSNLTVIPCKKRMPESVVKAKDYTTKQKLKRLQFQERMKRRKTRDKASPSQRKTLGIHASATDDLELKPTLNSLIDHVEELEPLVDDSLHNLQNGRPYHDTSLKETSAIAGVLSFCSDRNIDQGVELEPLFEESSQNLKKQRLYDVTIQKDTSSIAGVCSVCGDSDVDQGVELDVTSQKDTSAIAVVWSLRGHSNVENGDSTAE